MKLSYYLVLVALSPALFAGAEAQTHTFYKDVLPVLQVIARSATGLAR